MKSQVYTNEAKKSSIFQRKEPIQQKTAGANFLDNREETRIQQSFASMANGGASIQLKSRIDWDKLPQDVDKVKLREKVKALRDKRHNDKLELTKIWASSNGKGEGRDETYNLDIARVRMEYEVALGLLAKEHKIDKEVLISGDAYHGEEVGDSKVYRRPDVGKEYVKDDRGTFVPRYIRRELNHLDDLEGESISTQGIGTYGKLKKKKEVGAGGPGQITWPEREYLQQSIGGGSNLFALSHTATKRPILSNAHDSFGAKPEPNDHSGAVVTDLAKMGDKKFSAQWAIDPVFGHKVPVNAGLHTTLDKWSQKTKGTKPGSGAARDEKIRSSGYRNMEVVAEGIPKAAHLQPNDTWKTHEGPKTDYHSGTSSRGQEMLAYRQQKQQEVMEQIKLEKEPKEEEKVEEEKHD